MNDQNDESRNIFFEKRAYCKCVSSNIPSDRCSLQIPVGKLGNFGSRSGLLSSPAHVHHENLVALSDSHSARAGNKPRLSTQPMSYVDL